MRSFPPVCLHMLKLYDSVAKTFRIKFEEMADSADPDEYSAGFEHIPVDVHVPLLDIPDLPNKPLSRVLSKAVIQGSINAQRRDYYRIFADLITSLDGQSSSSALIDVEGG